MNKKLIFRLFMILVLTVVISGCGNSSQKGIYDKDGNPVFIDASEYDMLYLKPNNFKGKFVELSGQVFTTPEKDGDRVGFQIFSDVENYDKNTIVYYDDNILVKKDDYVKIIGYVLGEYSGTNAFGSQIKAPMIYAEDVMISNYKDVVSPTKKSVEYSNKTINQHGCILTINKVEFADNETRVYVSAANESNYNFNINTYSSKIIQNRKQYEQNSNFYADYPSLQSELLPNTISEGVLTFPPILSSSFELIISGYSDNWKISINDFKFELDVEEF